MTEQQNGSEKVQIRIPAEVAKIMKQWGGHSVKLAAARGALPMSGPNLVTVLFLFVHGDNEELKQESLNTFNTLPAKILLSALKQRDLHPTIIDLIARLRADDVVVIEELLRNPMTAIKTLMYLAQHGSREILDRLSYHDEALLKAPVLKKAIINNPNADKLTRVRMGWVEPQAKPEPPPADTEQDEDSVASDEAQEAGEDGFSEEEVGNFEEEILSKYQQLLEMPVSEKIKMALTGDKEWRTLLIREANKMVSSAVLKNPRITEGEVLAVAKSRSSSDDLIRIILLNREWIKNYEMKKALVIHPRTPLQKAMRFMTFLTEKDIKDLAKSRNVSQAIVNNARRMLMTKKH